MQIFIDHESNIIFQRPNTMLKTTMHKNISNWCSPLILGGFFFLKFTSAQLEELSMQTIAGFTQIQGVLYCSIQRLWVGQWR